MKPDLASQIFSILNNFGTYTSTFVPAAETLAIFDKQFIPFSYTQRNKLHVSDQMSNKKNKTGNSKPVGEPFPSILRKVMIYAAVILVTIIIGSIFYFKATVITLIVLVLATSIFVKRHHLTFIEEEYDLDIPVEDYHRHQGLKTRQL